jgi:protein arginine kinase activator
MLCQNCNKSNIFWKENGIGIPFSFQNILDGLFEVSGLENEEANDEIRCPVCNMSMEDFRRTGRVGCGNCYETFKNEMIPLVKRIHGGVQHTGKVPKRTGGLLKVRRDIDKLKEELKTSIDNEEYEKAAEIRDKIKELEKDANNENNKGEGEK